MTTKPWTARTVEDFLLEQYSRTHAGRLYVEVPIGGPGGSGQWPGGCTIRRLDGVLFLTSEAASIHRYHAAAPIFEADLRRFSPELIEVKASLNRTAIGQAIAGRRMFERQYGVVPRRTVILCRTSDAALAWVCEQEGIEVTSVGSNPPMQPAAGSAAAERPSR